MISIKQINKKDIDLCYELDSNTISLWSKKQWVNELKKEDVKVFGLLLSNLVIGICVFHVVLDEAQINFFVVNQKYRGKGYGSYLMSYLIKECEKSSINRIFLEVSNTNITAEKFYNRFEFSTVGIRKNYLEKAKLLLSLPRKIGDHPETGNEIFVNYGRYGGYLTCDNKNASLEDSSEVFDIGINNTVEDYLEALEKYQPDILGMSALLTTTMPYMKVVVDALKEKNLRDKYIVLVGGAPLNEEFGEAVGADAYCTDAAEAASIAVRLVTERRELEATA